MAPLPNALILNDAELLSRRFSSRDVYEYNGFNIICRMKISSLTLAILAAALGVCLSQTVPVILVPRPGFGAGFGSGFGTVGARGLGGGLIGLVVIGKVAFTSFPKDKD